MKETVKTTTVEQRLYECDVLSCTYSTYDKKTAKDHYAAYHTVAQKMEVGREEYLRFNHAADLQAYSEWRKGYYYQCEVDVFGPGWYKVTEEQVPCGKGCCDKEVLQFTSVEGVKREMLSNLHEMAENIRAFRKLFPEGE